MYDSWISPLILLAADAAEGEAKSPEQLLAEIGELKVISRSSAMRFKGTDKPLRQVASELGVQVLVEGSVMRAGDRARRISFTTRVPPGTGAPLPRSS